MPHANRPSGPGKPVVEQRDAARTQEELEDLSREPGNDAADAAREDPTRGPRTAERDAHTKSGGNNAGSDSGRRTGRQRT
jgi:hypothetical protein